MDYHRVVGKIQNLLEENNFWFESFEHEPVRTSEEAARVRPEYSLKQGAKAMVIKVKKSGGGGEEFVMLVFPGDLKFDNKKVKNILNAKETRFAAEQEVLSITRGVEPGAVPPFGNLFNLRVISDPKLFESEKIIFNAGDRSFSIAMKSADYKQLVNPEIFDIT
ncbi:MAG: hypothetical protein COX90_03330 [Candidatus Nealsonbacteria bacterium CG_4_10_14_0_2_um_filter_38_17]|uniref:YbaK/aminoacyl-tRNA synthetase-associated domain-containing protein n=2 Tax=Candidatus Nealsoniibacteriota TaxID=1817911 RepID=A0A2M7UXK1_9BACT|nr:MAG: hypothetical protein COX36_01460 [Candidatus Nealsonbacteria bacterium CG23_combo_of_CG06-09_8_20_14_all_38_19]PIZ88682.1 MAG: hypothetical protein COX90_03330 [Candidatus Nealsonbacteria bacterium CG_4_10_14_0_2_um_filter_38_17]